MVDTVHRLINACESATESREIWNIFLDYIKERGFGWCTYSYQFTPVQNKIQPKASETEHHKNDYVGLTWLTSVSQEASDEYLGRRYDRVDPVLHHVKQSLHPLYLGREFLDPNDPLFETYEALFKRAEAYGVYTGFCIPLRHPSGRGHGSITLHSSETKKNLLEGLKNHGAQVQLAAIYMHEFFQPLERKERAAEIGIKGRRFEVLAAVCAGKSNKEIADKCSVSEPTVSFHINNLKQQLNASNTRELVTAASQLGLFED